MSTFDINSSSRFCFEKDAVPKSEQESSIRANAGFKLVQYNITKYFSHFLLQVLRNTDTIIKKIGNPSNLK